VPNHYLKERTLLAGRQEITERPKGQGVCYRGGGVGADRNIDYWIYGFKKETMFAGCQKRRWGN